MIANKPIFVKSPLDFYSLLLNIKQMDKQKNYFHIALAVAVLIVAFSAWNYVRYYGASIEPSSFRSFSVSGEGKIVAVPDVAEFSFSVLTQGGTDITKLQKENTEKMNKAISFLKEKGVDSKDIKTENYNLEPRYQYAKCNEETGVCPPSEIVGYTITQSVAVKVRDFSKIGDIFSGVVTSGANSVSQLQFTIDEPEKLQNEAREKAIAQAKEKAKLVAKAGGFNIGRLLGIDENIYSPPIYYRSFKAESSGAGATVSPTIEAGSQEVKVNVTLRYEIK